MKRTPRHLLSLFVTGLLAALPLAATVAVFWWAASLVVSWLGPDSAVGSVLVKIGIGVTGSEVVGYIFSMAMIAGAIILLGAIVQAGLQRSAASIMDAILRRIPVVRTVYDLAHRMVGLFKPGQAEGPRSMRPVWCHFGGPGGASVLALLSCPQAVDVAGRRCLAVLVPTAPVPVGGGLLYVPEDWVSPARISIEALTSLYVSMGVTSPQHLPAPAAQARQPDQPVDQPVDQTVDEPVDQPVDKNPA